MSYKEKFVGRRHRRFARPKTRPSWCRVCAWLTVAVIPAGALAQGPSRDAADTPADNGQTKTVSIGCSPRSVFADHEWPAGVMAARDVFREVADRMDRDPAYTFAQSGAAIYAAVERLDPVLFERIKTRVKEGRWEIVGGRWAAVDPNLISAESNAHQFLYGQRYFRDRFGKRATVGWGPPGVGQPATMPELLAGAGMERFLAATSTGESAPVFHWSGLNSSRTLTVDASPRWRRPNPKDAGGLAAFLRGTGVDALLRLVDVSADARARSLDDDAVEWATLTGYFDDVGKRDLSSAPVRRGELKGALAGSYSLHSDMKLWNHGAETALVSAEALASIATLEGYPYPVAELRRLWRGVLEMQDYSLIGGAALEANYEFARVRFETAKAEADWISRSAARHLAARVPNDGPGYGVIVANPLGWAIGGVAQVSVEPGTNRTARYRITNSSGEEVAWQVVRKGSVPRLHFWADNVPGYGYDTFRIERLADASKPIPHEGLAGLDSVLCRSEEDGVRMENGWLKVIIDKTKGQIVSIFDKRAGREVLDGGRPGNVLEVHREHRAGSDLRTMGRLISVEEVTDRYDTTLTDLRPFQARVRIVWRYGKSSIQEYITLTAGSPRIDFETTINWEKADPGGTDLPVLRVAFPLAPAGQTRARFGVPFGDVKRPANGVEVPGSRWALLDGPEGGGAILVGARYGFSADADGVLRLTLMRPTVRTDPTSTVQRAKIVYSLLPTLATVSAADLTREGYQLDHPFVTVRLPPLRDGGTPRQRESDPLPARSGLFDGTRWDHVIPTCLKRAEDGKGLILRMYQAAPWGGSAGVHFRPPLGDNDLTLVDLIEDTVLPIVRVTDEPGGGLSMYRNFGGYEIKTVHFAWARDPVFGKR